jgi:hypothetical protein
MAEDPAQGPSKGQEALAALAGAAPGLIARLMSGGPDANVPPELRQLLAQSVQRQQYQNPLFQAVSQQAFQGLPAYARQGLSLPSTMPAAPSADSGGMPSWLKAALAGAGGAAAGNAVTGGNALGALIDGLKKLFQRGGTVQGNKPNAGGALTGPNAYDPSNFMGWGDAPDYGPSNPLLPSDPGVYTGWDGLPSDPSGGTGLGPGMQNYYGGFPSPADPNEE